LYHQGEVTQIIGCGGLGRWPPTEAAAIRAVLMGAAVPQTAISLEDRSTNTLENIRFALPILGRIGTSDVILVTDWYHAPRARLIGRRLGLTVATSSPPIAGASLKQQVRSALREIPAYVLAFIRV
jgi:uncharacterized SAM-binding protein YcdF (DUF218 family)